MTPSPIASLSIAPRRERNAAETRRRILDAAEVEFAAKGFDGARLGSIARAGEAQQALIHHYFEDKAGLYRAVIARALDVLSREGWDILATVNAASMPPPPLAAVPARPRKGDKSARAKTPAARAKAEATRVDVPKLVAAFVESMIRFYATHLRILAILRHEAHSGGALAGEVVKSTTKPVFDAIVLLLERLQRQGEIQRDFDPRHLCISAVAMSAWPFQEQAFVSMVFPMDVRDPAFVAEREREVTRTILERITLR